MVGYSADHVIAAADGAEIDECWDSRYACVGVCQ